jgi:hypothetical protein
MRTLSTTWASPPSWRRRLMTSMLPCLTAAWRTERRLFGYAAPTPSQASEDPDSHGQMTYLVDSIDIGAVFYEQLDSRQVAARAREVQSRRSVLLVGYVSPPLAAPVPVGFHSRKLTLVVVSSRAPASTSTRMTSSVCSLAGRWHAMWMAADPSFRIHNTHKPQRSVHPALSSA